MDLAVDVVGESTARTWSCWAAFYDLLLCCCAPTPSGISVQGPHHRDRPALGHRATPGHCFAASSHTCGGKSMEEDFGWNCLLHLLCRRTFPDINCVEGHFMTCPCSTEGSLQHRIPCKSHHSGLSSGCSRIPEQRMLPAEKGGRISMWQIAPSFSLGTAFPTGHNPGQLPSSSIIHLHSSRGKIHLGMVRLTEASHISISTELCSPSCTFSPQKMPSKMETPFIKGQEHEG